jgi:hypothetical protein
MPLSTIQDSLTGPKTRQDSFSNTLQNSEWSFNNPLPLKIRCVVPNDNGTMVCEMLNVDNKMAHNRTFVLIKGYPLPISPRKIISSTLTQTDLNLCF